MKKLLLVISLVIISISSAFAAGLNAYAFGTGYIHDTNTNKLHIIWSQQALGDVTIVALDANDNRYVLAEYEDREPKRHEEIIDLWSAVAAGMPTSTDLRVAIEVRTEDQTPSKTKHEFVKKIDFQWPFSIDIDRNPYSKYFGLMYVGQVNSSNDRGIYVLDQQGGLARGAQIDKDIKLYDLWYDETHAVPYMVRTLQDGTGRLLISSADKSQNTHLWLATPQTGDAVPVYSEWTDVVTSAQLRDWTGHGVAKDYFSNAGLDIRENGDYWDILLYMSTASSGTANHDGGNAYSGVYRVSKSSTDLTGGTYISYTAPTPNSSYSSGFKPHDVISNAYTSSVFNASANFDMFGGVMYNATSEGNNADKSAFIHRTQNGIFKADYADEDYLKRGKARTKGARFSSDFSKFAIAQGRMADELRIYDVSQADGNSHVTLSNGQSVNIITGTSGVTYADRVFVHDIAWDYAMNVYASVRNEGSKYGIYAVATDLNGKPIITPIKGTFNVQCSEGEEEFTISLSSNINEAGTLTGAGTYASCTQVTVTATPDDKHKFLRWSEDGIEVSKEQSYTFYATKNRNLVAEFEYAVYDVEWYGLFQEHQDITDYITNPNSSMDGKTNSRLWRLFQVELNKYHALTLSDGGTKTLNSGKVEFNVLNFLQGIPTSNRLSYTKAFMENENSPFYWLGKYIMDIAGVTTIKQTSSDGKSDINVWGYYLYCFFNRTNTPRNTAAVGSDDVTAWLKTKGITSPDFRETGKPTYWRNYWTEYACELMPSMSYGDAMPVEWTKLPEPTSSITVGQSTLSPGNWYKWNNQEANPDKLLGWYYDDKNNPTWPTNPTIVRNVDHSGALFATWVEKLVSEEETTQHNSDAIFLLNHHNGTHDIKVLRKMQGGMYNTLCLPFSATKAQQPAVLQNATIVQFTGVNENLYDESGEPVVELQFTKVDDIVAGVPYLVMPQTDITSEMTFTNIPTGYNGNTPLVMETAQEITKSTNNGSISFIGNIHPTNIPAQSLIVVANNRLAEVTEAGEIQHMRGYFRIDDAQLQTLSEEGKVYLSMRKPTTTSVPLAPEAEQPAQPKVQKIMRNGKIYILRGDEIYTITGARVR